MPFKRFITEILNIFFKANNITNILKTIIIKSTAKNFFKFKVKYASRTI